MKLKKISFYFLLILNVLLMLSCKNPDLKSENVTEEKIPDSLYVQEIEKINNDIYTLMMKGDYEPLLKYYTDDIIVIPALEPTIRGKNALREQYIKQEKEGVVFHSFNAKTEKIWSAGNKVYEYGTYGLSGSTKNHTDPVARRGNFFVIWEKQNNGSYLTSYVMINIDHYPRD
jgi:ketosteroid isomerase-like protein